MDQHSLSTLMAPTKIPTLADLGKELGFGKHQNRSLNELTDSTHQWRRQHECSDGSSGVDLLEWKKARIQAQLTVMTKSYLEEGGYGRKWWPSSTNPETSLQYEVDQERIVKLLNMIFWRQNIYSSRNAKYCDAKRQRDSEEVASSQDNISVEKAPSVTPRLHIAPKQPEHHSKGPSPSFEKTNSHQGRIQKSPGDRGPRLFSLTRTDYYENGVNVSRHNFSATPTRHVHADSRPTESPGRRHRTSFQAIPSVEDDGLVRRSTGGAIANHHISLSDATTAVTREDPQSEDEVVTSPTSRPESTQDMASRNILLLKYRRSLARAQIGPEDSGHPRSDLSPDRFSTPDLSFVHEFFASKDGEENCDRDHPLLIVDDGAMELADTPRRSSKRKRKQNSIPGAVSKALYEEATRSETEEENPGIVLDRLKRVRKKNTHRLSTPRSGPKDGRRVRISKSQAITVEPMATSREQDALPLARLPMAYPRIEEAEEDRPQPHETRVVPVSTSTENGPGKPSTKGDIKVPPAAPKPVIGVYFFFVKARKPRLVLQRWPEGKFRGKTLDFVFEAASRITGRKKIEQLRCNLFTAEKELEEILQSGAEESFETIKELFNEEMTKAFEKNRNELKRFEIYIEPIDCDDLTKDGDAEIEDAEMGDW